jgi:hypothetical protein
VDVATIEQIVMGKFDVANLIKLIPPEDRPKGAANTSLPSGVTFQFDSGRPTLTTTHQLTVYEKTYSDFPSFLQALSVYAAIRAQYDRDNSGIGTAILLYIRKLATWVRLNYSWNGVLMYAIAHFRLYQSSHNSLDWTRTDTELYTSFIARYSQLQTAISSSGGKKEHCRNWNSAKGCTWKQCTYKHRCNICGGSHPTVQCTTKPEPSSVASGSKK